MRDYLLYSPFGFHFGNKQRTRNTTRNRKLTELYSNRILRNTSKNYNTFSNDANNFCLLSFINKYRPHRNTRIIRRTSYLQTKKLNDAMELRKMKESVRNSIDFKRDREISILSNDYTDCPTEIGEKIDVNTKNYDNVYQQLSEACSSDKKFFTEIRENSLCELNKDREIELNRKLNKKLRNDKKFISKSISNLTDETSFSIASNSSHTKRFSVGKIPETFSSDKDRRISIATIPESIVLNVPKNVNISKKTNENINTTSTTSKTRRFSIGKFTKTVLPIKNDIQRNRISTIPELLPNSTKIRDFTSTEINVISKHDSITKGLPVIEVPKTTSLNVQKSSNQKIRSPMKKKILLPFTKWRNSGKKFEQTDIRIQQIDGGFFERFGALFRDYGQPVPTTQLKKPPNIDALLNGEDIAEENEGEDSQDVQTTENDERNSDSGIDSINDADSEPESELLKSHIISESVGWNIDELYSEILYEILHNVGCDQTVYETGQTALFNYLQEAFKMSYDKHNALLDAAEKKEAPEILLNVEIVEGKDMVPKDPNGLSDPFVTLFLQSLPTHRYNTSVKSATLNPTWEEHFSLPVSENAQDDTLCLEVWDFDPAETVREKMGKIMEVRGVKGLRKLVKEIAITASTGQHENEFIGRAAIPLSTIPASGMTMWYSLDKKNKAKRQGVLRIRLSFSSQKQPRVAAQEHQHLLKILLLHELETSKVVPYWWCGNFSAQAESLITQHAAQSGLGPTEQALCQWVVYSQVHADHPLSFTMFSNLLDKLIRPLQANSLCEEEVKVFWEASKKLLPYVFNTIRKIRKKSTGDKNILKQVIEVLRIVAKMSLLEPPEKINLFPSDLYRWLTYKNDDESNWDFRGTLGDAIQQGAIDWFEHVLEHNPCHDHTDEAKMQHLIKIIQLVRSDLQRAIEYYDKIFQEIVSFQYAKSLYILFEKRLTQLIEPEILDICKSLKRLRFDEAIVVNNDNVSEPMAQGTTLFELYLVVQKFVVLGTGLCPTDSDSFHIKEFYLWFHGGVAQWLDIAVYKALQRIQKAVELDNLIPVSPDVKYSSSAVDTLTIFYQIKVFWQQLNWPDVEGSYTFVAKIIDDICRCCVYYADKMSSKVDGMGDVENVFEKKFEVTNEWCLAINNIDYVRQSLQPFVNELNMEEILKKLSDLRSPLEAERCRQTLQNVIENAIDTVKNKIIELLEIVVKKMVPPMRRLLIEGAELLPTDSNSMDRIMRYLDDNLATLHEQLNEDNFQRTLDVLWDNVAEILSNILETNLEKRRPPSFYHSLNETLKLMLRTFKQSNSSSLTTDFENLNKIAHLLALNGQETNDLIHSVHLERWEDQMKIESAENATPPYGQLTVRCKFQGCTLKIEVMNARNLIPMDTNGSCDSFVRIHFLPEDKFLNVMKPKTQTQNKTLFPLYDETFTIVFSPQQRDCKNGLIMFSIKDKDFLGMSNQYVCEAYLHFKDIPDTPETLESLPQMHLTLTRPHKLDSEALKALEHRQGDKQAKEFIKKYRQKMSPPVPS